MGEDGLVRVTRRGHVAWVRLDNPDRMNCMDESMGASLTEAVADLGQDEEVRVIVLTGTGRAFSAGGDLDMLAENASAPPHRVEKRMRAFYGRYLTIREVPKPVIAAINGYAIGAGMAVALACDLRIATPEARMGVNFAKLALSPGMGTTYLLPRVVGVPAALDLLMTGRLIDGQEALRMGLVNRLAEAEELEAEADAWAAELAANGPIALRLIKSLVHGNIDVDLGTALDREASGQAVTFGSSDLAEGLAAIRAKRPPEFRGE